MEFRHCGCSVSGNRKKWLPVFFAVFENYGHRFLGKKYNHVENFFNGNLPFFSKFNIVVFLINNIKNLFRKFE